MLGMATKKLKLEEEPISEILVADTDSESGAEISDVEEEFEEEDEQQEQQLLLLKQASAEYKPQAATSGRGLPPWGAASRKEHKCSSFCQSSKRCEKK